MRVIAGKFRSRTLAAPASLGTRPTSDRLRETLFNVLSPRIGGATFADLYSGSGAVGIEALSRGAALVYFVEQAEIPLVTIRANLKALGIVSGYGLEPRSVSGFLRRQLQIKTPQASSILGPPAAQIAPSTLDLVFLDPPYESAVEYSSTLGLLGGECGALLSEGSMVIAEHARRAPLETEYGSLERYRLLEQGDAALSFYRKS